MTHIENLLMNTVREAVEKLQRSGVGYIGLEETGVIHYMIDEKLYMISVEEQNDEKDNLLSSLRK